MVTIEQKLSQVGGVVLTHSALLVTILGVLKARGLITQADIGEMIETALTGIENNPNPVEPDQSIARRSLEDWAEMFAESNRR